MAGTKGNPSPDKSGKGGSNDQATQGPRLDLSGADDLLEGLTDDADEARKPPLPDFDAKGGGTNGKENDVNGKKSKPDKPDLDLKSLAERLATMDGENKDLRKRVEELTREKGLADEEVEELKDKLKQVNESLRTIPTDSERDSTIKELQGQIKVLEGRVTAQVVGDNSDELASVKKELDASDAEVARLRNNLKDLEKKLAGALKSDGRTPDEKDKQIEELKAALADSNKSREAIRDKAKAEVGRLMKKLDETEKAGGGGGGDGDGLKELQLLCLKIGREGLTSIEECRDVINSWIEKRAGKKPAADKKSASGDDAKEDAPTDDKKTDEKPSMVKGFLRGLFN